MTGYPGLDTYADPGPALLGPLAAHFGICGIYLAPAPSHGDTSWMAAAPTLRAQSWRLVPIFLCQELPSGPGSHSLTTTQAADDAVLVAHLMAAAGCSARSRVFIDLEDPGMAAGAPLHDYVIPLALGIQAQGYQPDVYSSHTVSAQLRQALIDAGVKDLLVDGKSGWVYRVSTVEKHDVSDIPTQDPAGCGDALALGWQCEQDADIQVPGAGRQLNVDLSTWAVADPCAPALAA